MFPDTQAVSDRMYENDGIGWTCSAHRFGLPRHVGYVHRMGTLYLYSQERHRERGELMQAFKTVKGLAEVQDNHGALFQIREI